MGEIIAPCRAGNDSTVPCVHQEGRPAAVERAAGAGAQPTAAAAARLPRAARDRRNGQARSELSGEKSATDEPMMMMAIFCLSKRTPLLTHFLLAHSSNQRRDQALNHLDRLVESESDSEAAAVVGAGWRRT